MKLFMSVVIFVTLWCFPSRFAFAQSQKTSLPAALEDAADEPQNFSLWDKGAPGALGNSPEDIPTITSYEPWRREKPGPAVIIAPGGSYQFLAANHEGRQVANWFNAMGITAFVLKYRLGPRYHHPWSLAMRSGPCAW